MKPTAILLGIFLVLTVGACARRDGPPPEGRISHERNSAFDGQVLEVF